MCADDGEESDETFTVTLRNPGNAALGTQTSTRVTIADNDILPIRAPIRRQHLGRRRQGAGALAAVAHLQCETIHPDREIPFPQGCNHFGISLYPVGVWEPRPPLKHESGSSSCLPSRVSARTRCRAVPAS